MCIVTRLLEKCITVFIPKLTKTFPVWINFTGRIPDWFLADNPRLAELEEILKGPESITWRSRTSVSVKWHEESHERQISLYDRIAVAVFPLDTVPISFATLLLPPLYNDAPQLDSEPPCHDHDDDLDVGGK